MATCGRRLSSSITAVSPTSRRRWVGCVRPPARRVGPGAAADAEQAQPPPAPLNDSPALPPHVKVESLIEQPTIISYWDQGPEKRAEIGIKARNGGGPGGVGSSEVEARRSAAAVAVAVAVDGGAAHACGTVHGRITWCASAAASKTSRTSSRTCCKHLMAFRHGTGAGTPPSLAPGAASTGPRPPGRGRGD